MWEIEVREEENPFLARIIICDEWRGDPVTARRILESICDKWPEGKRTIFLITCGGFIEFNWPDSLPEIGDTRYPNEGAVNVLVNNARKCVETVLNQELRDMLKKRTNYVTLGLDSHEELGNLRKLHIELVFLVDLTNDQIYWTGKSYPTVDQVEGLIRIADLETHFLNLDVGEVMVLGCHDLTVFNPRAQATSKGWRKRVNERFRAIAKMEKPKYVLHHPHTTVKKRTWLQAWKGLESELTSVIAYAGAGRYHEPNQKYDSLNEVLRCTKRGRTIDFIVSMA